MKIVQKYAIMVLLILIIKITSTSDNPVINKQEKIKYEKNEALLDLEYMYTTLLDNHPGVYNNEDPGFITHLHYAFNEYVQKIKITDSNELLSFLTGFTKSFNDKHLGVSFHNYITNKPTSIKRKEFCSVSLQKNIQWISLPTFFPNNDEQKILQDIIANMSSMRSYKLIIFDVRGNGGGSSYWGKTIVEHLFGQAYVKIMCEYVERHVYVDWRASKKNIDYLNQLHPLFETQYGINGEVTQWLTSTINSLQQAYDQGLLLYSDKKAVHNDIVQTINVIDNPVKAKIIVITDKGCGSACLNFIDYLKAMEHDVVLFGQTTGADTLYMEIQTVDLPSKKGTFCFPMKVYRNRPRGNNVSFFPDVLYDGDMHDTANLQQVIIKRFCL